MMKQDNVFNKMKELNVSEDMINRTMSKINNMTKPTSFNQRNSKTTMTIFGDGAEPV